MTTDSSGEVNYCYFEVLGDFNQAVKVVKVAEGATIGRALENQELDILVPAECQSTSRRHATLAFLEGSPILTDHSKFGTIVNNRVTHGESVVLNEYDTIIFGWKADGWRIRVQFHEIPMTAVPKFVEMVLVSVVPRKVMIRGRDIDERMGNKAFDLLHFLAANTGQWFPINHLAEIIWSIPDDAPEMPNIALAKMRRSVNDYLREPLEGEDAIDMIPFNGYSMKKRLWQAGAPNAPSS